MKRAAIIWVLASSAVAIVLVYGIDSYRAASNPKSGATQHISSLRSELDQSSAVIAQRSLDAGENLRNDGQNPTARTAAANTSYVDEATDRKLVREEATREVPIRYALLLEHLDLTATEKEALLAFLIEDRIASTRTRYSSGEGIPEHERSGRIADIIGDSKHRQFLTMERNLSEYVEVQRVQSMLKQHDVPLTDAQREKFLSILVETRNSLSTTLPVDIKRRTIEHLEHVLAQMDEYERLVLELAPSALSSKQVQYLFERYQAGSYNRSAALERQRIARAGPTSENRLLTYPPRD